MNTIMLHSDCLLSKYGFEDGDVLDDLIDGSGVKPEKWEDPNGYGFYHWVLIKLVKEFLLPALPRTIEIYTMMSIHNPIRAEKPDECDDIKGVIVEVSYDDVLRIASEMASR